MNTTHLYLGIAGDGPVFHFSTTTPGAYAGHAVIGPEKLIEWLELHMGLSGIYPTEIERALRLKELLTEDKRGPFFFSKSFKSDPLGVTRRLLALCDTWILSGWDIESAEHMPPRMQALAGLKDIVDACGLGFSGRVKVLLQYPIITSIPPVVIHLIDPPEYFPYVIQQVLSKLKECVKTDYQDISANADAGSDLRKLQDILNGNTSAEAMQNDHSLQCIFFDDDIAEANALYSLQLAADWKPVIVGQDRGLLNGLHISQYHPVSRWQTNAGNGQVSQLFFLATAMFRRPINTSQVIAFLSAPLTPFPKKLAGSLVQVFSERPGFGNVAWNEVITDYLKGVAGDDKVKKEKKRIAFWLQNKAFLDEPGLSVKLLEEIYHQLGSWASTAANHSYSSLYIDQLLNLSSICEQMIQSLKGEGELVTVSKFERLQAELFSDPSSIIADAEAGSSDSFSSPQAIWSACRELAWMNAIRFEPTNDLTRYWYQEEKTFFVQQGLPLHDESHMTAAYNFGLKRMVMSVKDRLIITIPAVVSGAVAAKPFCLDEWNKLISLKPVTLEQGHLLETIPWNRDKGLLRQYTPIALPAPAAYFSIEKEIFQREKESYSSIDKLIQHPAEWYMDYRLKLRHIAGIAVPNANIIKGIIADRVIQEMFTETNRKTTWWQKADSFLKKVDDVCMTILLQEGLPFLEKQTKRLLMEYKLTLAHSLENLKRFIDANNLIITATQYTVSGTIEGTPFEGFIDLLLQSPGKNIVIDLKWANSSRSYRERLKTGNDLQLVLYARILDSGASSGYFMLNDGNAFMRNETSNQRLLHVQYEEPAENISTHEVYKHAIAGIQYRRRELAAGKAEAGYDEPLENLDYYRETAALSLYPLKENGPAKQNPYDDDFYLFYGKII